MSTMRRICPLLFASWVLAAWPYGSSGAELPNGPAAFAPRAVEPIDDRAMAGAIDRALAARWASAGATPAPPADDAEFLRRVALDVAGRIPPASEARAFLDSDDPEKRRRLVERLLSGHAYANQMTSVWSELLIPESRGNIQLQILSGDFEVWLRKQFADGVGYDAMVRELLTVSPQNGLNRAAVNVRDARGANPTPFAFLAAKEGKPENLAASASRLFLGLRLECAQCHNHPFARWKREEFWGMAAFFSGLQRQGPVNARFVGTEDPTRHEIEMPGTKRLIRASFLDGRDVEWTKGSSARATLAEWLTSRDNPYFARAAANRIWSQFFGVGLVDPVDDLTGEPSHPELLDLLADQFAAHGFDPKYLIRAITSSRAYQLTSAGGSPSEDVYRLFDRMPVRGLSPLQLYESLMQATGLPREPVTPGIVIGRDSPRGDFLERFASQEERPTERQTSILQALTLMNGRLVDDATSLDRGATLSGVADAYFLDTAGRIEALYLATLTRRPRPDELERLVPYVERGGPTLNPRKALADVLWSLLGSAEFVFNH
jgi:hypothetical protein